MKLPLIFTRLFFIVLSMILMIAYATEMGQQWNIYQTLNGATWGAALSVALLALEIIFYRLTIRAFNVLALGLLFGYSLGYSLSIVFQASFALIDPQILATQQFKICNIALFIASSYLAVLATFKSSEEFYLSIPFVRLKPVTQRKKDLLIDISVLADSRIIDFANAGLVDHHLILPRFVLDTLYKQVDSEEESIKNRSRRSLEVIKKLESLPHLHMRSHDVDFPELKQTSEKLIKLARLLDANIFTADMTSLETVNLEEVRVINIHTLSNALKPLMHSNENLMIKIQRFGKEAMQGVGYLEDGTMVVVNGGGEFIGKIIKCRVLSVKHTSSGRIIFCNTHEENIYEESHFTHSQHEDTISHKEETLVEF